MGRSWSQLGGFLLVLSSIALFLYYTFWAAVLPFVEPEHPIHAYFLPRKYVVIIPSIILVLGIGVLGSRLRIRAGDDSASTGCVKSFHTPIEKLEASKEGSERQPPPLLQLR